jgi:hypothetical protein
MFVQLVILWPIVFATSPPPKQVRFADTETRDEQIRLLESIRDGITVEDESSHGLIKEIEKVRTLSVVFFRKCSLSPVTRRVLLEKPLGLRTCSIIDRILRDREGTGGELPRLTDTEFRRFIDYKVASL